MSKSIFETYLNVTLTVDTYYGTFYDMQEGQIPFSDLYELNKSFKEYLSSKGVKNSYDFLRIEAFGKVYKFGIFDGIFTIWTSDGGTVVDHYSIKNLSCPDLNFCSWISSTLRKFGEGYVKCSDCGKWIKSEEVAGRYFAGQYCKECWEGKWRAIEAQETYN